MANILVIEDSVKTIDHIHEVLEPTHHNIIGEPNSLGLAQPFLSKIISHEIYVDILLLDGNLDPDDRPTEFRHTFPPDGSEPIEKTFFGRTKPPRPREIVIPNKELGLGGDARMVKRIMRVCGITVPIIGISGDPMKWYGVEVDKDLTKQGIRTGLISAIDELMDKETNG